MGGAVDQDRARGGTIVAVGGEEGGDVFNSKKVRRLYHVVAERPSGDRLILETYGSPEVAERRAEKLRPLLEGYRDVRVECDTGFRNRPVGGHNRLDDEFEA